MVNKRFREKIRIIFSTLLINLLRFGILLVGDLVTLNCCFFIRTTRQVSFLLLGRYIGGIYYINVRTE